MNKKQLILVGVVVLVGIGALLLFGHIRTSAPSVSVSTSTETNAGGTNRIPIAASSTQPILQNEYHVNLPNGVMLVDSMDRRTGRDPATGTIYHEIPGTSYGEDGLSPTNRVGELFFSQAPNAHYTLYILGGKRGGFWLDAQVSQPFVLRQTVSGNTQAGSMAIYSLNNDTADLTSSTLLLFQGTASSTASITSAPPHNLPPPPVPK